MRKFQIGDKVTIQERCHEGKENKNIIFKVVDYPYNSESRDGDDYVTIQSEDKTITYKAFLITFLDLAKEKVVYDRKELLKDVQTKRYVEINGYYVQLNDDNSYTLGQVDNPENTQTYLSTNVALSDFIFQVTENYNEDFEYIFQ